MKTTFFLPILIVIIFSATYPAHTQDHNFLGPNEGESFFLIGWSQNRINLAYGWYHVTSAISTLGNVVVQVKSLDTDRIKYQYTDVWDEGNAGDGQDGWYPKTAIEAWNEIKDNVSPNLDEQKIVWDPVFTTVYSHDKMTYIKAEARVLEDKTGSGIYLVSEKYGERLIYESAYLLPQEIYIHGIVLAPGEVRGAIILRTPLFDFPYFEYHVKGFWLDDGFIQNEVIGP